MLDYVKANFFELTFPLTTCFETNALMFDFGFSVSVFIPAVIPLFVFMLESAVLGFLASFNRSNCSTFSRH